MTPKDLERSWVSSKDWRRNLVSSADILASDLAGWRVAHRAAFIDRANVRLGSKTEVAPVERHVPFTLQERTSSAAPACPKSAKTGSQNHPTTSSAWRP
jgi:hypothetical protein